MKKCLKVMGLLGICATLSGCLVTSVVSGVVGTAVGVVDAVTPDIVDQVKFQKKMTACKSIEMTSGHFFAIKY